MNDLAITLCVLLISIASYVQTTGPSLSVANALKKTSDKKESLLYGEVTITAKPGMADSLQIQLLLNALDARTEEECLLYEVYRNLNDRSVFILFENWVDQSSIRKHIEMPYIKKWLSKRDKVI
jgi:quinol monooxygenase YgiN